MAHQHNDRHNTRMPNLLRAHHVVEARQNTTMQTHLPPQMLQRICSEQCVYNAQQMSVLYRSSWHREEVVDQQGLGVPACLSLSRAKWMDTAILGL